MMVGVGVETTFDETDVGADLDPVLGKGVASWDQFAPIVTGL